MSNYGLRVLDPDECRAALKTQRVGRVAVPAAGHPVVLPVLYAVLDDDVIFRTAPGEKLIAAALHRVVAFEIDEFDPVRRTGWSVNVIGPVEEIVDSRELARAEELGLDPWAGELRNRFVRIRATDITGRAIDPSNT